MKHSKTLSGIPVSAGIAMAPVLHYSYDLKHLQDFPVSFVDADKETERFKRAVEKSKQQLREIKGIVSTQKVDTRDAAIFDTHVMFLEDPMVVEETLKQIKAQRKNSEYIFYNVIDKLAKTLDDSDDENLRMRTVDLYDVANRVVKNLRETYTHLMDELKENVIVVSYDLGPSDTAHMIHGKVIAFATERGGPTSHTAIMAKALEIPAVVGIDNITRECGDGDTIIVDGSTGMVIINPTDEQVKEYKEKARQYREKEEILLELRDLPAKTKDGHIVALEANIELPQEVHHAALHGADGIGLYRTEFIYLDKDVLPSEEQQFGVYKKAVAAMAPRPVVFRTIDLGGDKFASFIPVPEELNPFLGSRAIRLCLQFPDIFRTQLRALLRASALGNVMIMLPMVSDTSEIKRTKAMIEEVKKELDGESKAYNPDCKIGVMIEVPAAVMAADVLAREADFFSLGTNDLIQYTFAVDRINEKVAHLYQPLHPAILRMIKMVIDAAHRQNIWVGVCGEMAADPMVAMILIGLGIDKLSMASINIPEVKRLVRTLTYKEAQRLALTVLGKDTVEEIKNLVHSRLCSLEQ